MHIITKSEIDNLSVGGRLSGTVLIKDYTVGVTRNRSNYIDGTLYVGKPVPFKIWSSADGLVEAFQSSDYTNTVCDIDAKLDSYNGSSYLIISGRCEKVEEPVDVGVFLPVKYDKDSFLDALKALLSINLSPEGYALADKLIFSNTLVYDRFITEYCAKSHHDNCLSGLLVHTFKVVDLMCFISSRYSFLHTFPSRDLDIPMHRTDLLIIGALIHDWGKTLEMKYGVYQPNSAVTHRVFGIEMLMPFKDYIISVYDEKWYYDLVSVISQHHGEYGEDCKTIYSYIMHQVDMLDTMLTGLGDNIENSLRSSSAGNCVKVDTRMLYL